MEFIVDKYKTKGKIIKYRKHNNEQKIDHISYANSAESLVFFQGVYKNVMQKEIYPS